MTFLVSCIEQAARTFLRGGDLNRRASRAAVERDAFGDEFPDGPYIPGFDYTPAAMQDMGANCAAAAEMFTQHTSPRASCGQFRASHHDAHCIGPCDAKTSAVRPPGVAETPGRATVPPVGAAGHRTPAQAGSQHGLPPGGGETPTSPAAGHLSADADPFCASLVVELAARFRHEYYFGLGAEDLPWSKLTDAQKLPWLMAAHADLATSAQRESGVAPGQGEAPAPSQGGPVESGSGAGHTDFWCGYEAAVDLVEARADADERLAGLMPEMAEQARGSADTLRDLAKYMRHIAPK